MKVLSSKQVLQDNHTTDVNAITSLTFTHRAISDVSCLIEFKNLERLDLTFNNLSSLEGLKPCVNLKWLSVKQNKLRSLKGIEGLVHLTVLNAGSNMLQSMEEVTNLVRLRALILNDNEIASISRLDQMKDLNTVVLSRNPICKIGESLGKANSITKLSLSNCKIQGICSSIKHCTELRELRLAHNEIRTLPTELTKNVKIQNLDLGSNLIMRWSDLKILSSLVNMKNLNLVGNPVAEKDILAKKIKKLVPSIQIFNARPIDKITMKVKGGEDKDLSIDVKKGQKAKKNKPTQENASDSEENNTYMIKEQKTDKEDTLADSNLGKKRKHKSGEINIKQHSNKRTSDNTFTEKRKDAIDDAEIPFIDPLAAKSSENGSKKNKVDVDGGAVVTFPKKKKSSKSKIKGSSVLQLLGSEAEVGLGGPSTWD